VSIRILGDFVTCAPVDEFDGNRHLVGGRLREEAVTKLGSECQVFRVLVAVGLAQDCGRIVNAFGVTLRKGAVNGDVN
jgi:hypothetical protein